jgi:hypothetical protein
VSPSQLRALAELVEPLARVLADRLEHAVAPLPVGPLLLADEVVLEQGLEVVEVGLADGFGGLQPAPAGEDREPREQRLLRLVQEPVAPVDRAAERLLARRQVTRAGRQ